MKVAGIVGWHNSGKTTLVVALVRELTARGYRVSTVKHAHHEFDVDTPGKDSWHHREAGAAEVMVGSSKRWVLMHELRGSKEPELDELLSHISPVDLVLVEGFKNASHEKIEVYRDGLDDPPDCLYNSDSVDGGGERCRARATETGTPSGSTSTNIAGIARLHRAALVTSLPSRRAAGRAPEAWRNSPTTASFPARA